MTPLALLLAVVSPLGVQTIVSRSVQNTVADWKAAPRYNYVERDVVLKNDERTVKTYQVMMIEGSPYYKLIAENDEPLSSKPNGKG